MLLAAGSPSFGAGEGKEAAASGVADPAHVAQEALAESCGEEYGWG